jgi:MFS family permease
MFGAFFNGPIADRFSRRWSILLANIVFLIGSIIQCAAVNVPMIFVGRFIAGISIGQLSMVVPLYLSELAPPNLRGGLVALQQLGITVGIMIAFWLDYGTQHIGGTGDGQSQVAWRLPLALQIVPSLILGIGTFFLPYSPRWLMEKGKFRWCWTQFPPIANLFDDRSRGRSIFDLGSTPSCVSR